jgi:hypothetical protein
MNVSKGIILKARNVLQYQYDKMQEVMKGVTHDNMWELVNSPECAEYYASKRMYELFIPEIVEAVDGKLTYKEIKEI